MTIFEVSRPKYSSRERWLTTMFPEPGLIQTRATEVFLLPVA
jgi:hypothetical protein